MSSTLTIAEMYSALAAEYERTRVPRFRPFVKKLLQMYDTRPKSRVLDAGTGTGLAATMVAPRVGREGKVIGVDASEGMLALAREKARNFGFTQCEFRVGDIHALEFPDDTFDVVMSSFAHFGEPAHLFSEFLRVLKPEAALVFQAWSPQHAAPEAAYEKVFARFSVTQPPPELARWRAAGCERERWEVLQTPADYERLLQAVGFREAQAHLETIPQHFENGAAYVDWRAVHGFQRVELAAMSESERAEFLHAAAEALHPFETAKGLDFDWSAIQVVARK